VNKILHIVVETGSLAGGVRVIGELANRLTDRGWKVSIWSVNPRKTIEWFKLSSLVEWNSFYRAGTVADYDQLADVLKKQAGFKLATFWRTAFAVQYAAQPGEGLYHIQDIETSYTSQPLVAAEVMRTYAMGFRHLTTSKWVKSQLDCEYIGIGIDNYWKRLDKFRREKWPLACARVQALKGWPELCEAARYLDRQSYFLHTYGMNKHHMVARHEHHHPGGPMGDKELRVLYNTAGVFISTSRHEGFSLTPLEAALCGCPAVLTPADGNLEYISDGENCLLATTPQEVSEKAVEILKDRALGEKLARSLEKRAQEYRWPEVVTRLETALLGPA